MKNILNKIKNINNKNKILIIIGIVLVIGIGLFIILNRDNIFKSNNKVAINDKPIVEEIKVADFNEITVVSSRIEKLGNIASIYVKIKNNTNDVIDNSNLKLTIYDKDNNILLVSYIENVKKLEIGDEVEFQVSTEKDLNDASKYVVEKVINE